MRLPCFALLFVGILSSTGFAAPEWTQVVNEKEKLHGGIVVGDDFGEHWHGELPWGWVEVDEETAISLMGDPGYVDLGQITVVVEGSNVIFSVSRQNIASRYASDPALTNLQARLDGLPEIGYREEMTSGPNIFVRLYLMGGNLIVESFWRFNDLLESVFGNVSWTRWPGVAVVVAALAFLMVLIGTLAFRVFLRCRHRR